MNYHTYIEKKLNDTQLIINNLIKELNTNKTIHKCAKTLFSLIPKEELLEIQKTASLHIKNSQHELRLAYQHIKELQICTKILNTINNESDTINRSVN